MSSEVIDCPFLHRHRASVTENRIAKVEHANTAAARANHPVDP
jgi:hypothetical protein